MDYEKYAKVEQLANADQANTYLGLGWKLLLVCQYSNEDVSRPSYVLGWDKSLGEPVVPEAVKHHYGTVL